MPALVGQVTDSFKFLLQRRGVEPQGGAVRRRPGRGRSTSCRQAGSTPWCTGWSSAGPRPTELGLAAHEDIVAQAVQEASGGTVGAR